MLFHIYSNTVNNISSTYKGPPDVVLIYNKVFVCLFVCVEAQRPSQQFFSHVGTEPPFPVYYLCFQGVKCLAQGHNTAEVGFEPPTSCSGVRRPTLYH